MRGRLTVVGLARAHVASHVVLLVAQLAPIVAIWRLDWGLHDLFLLYLLEFLLVGAVTALRIATNGVHRVGFDVDAHGRPLPSREAPPPDAEDSEVVARLERWGRHVEKPAAVFALVRRAGGPLLFYLLVGGVFAFEGHGSFTSSPDGAWLWTGVVLALMAAHHGVSYVLHDLRRAERFALDLPWIVDRGYARAVAVAGLWAAAFLGTPYLHDPRVALTCVIGAKALLEAGLHERERG